MKITLLLLLITPFALTAQINPPKTIDINRAAYKILPVGEKPDFIALDGENDAWVVDDHQNRIIKVSANSNKTLLTIPVPEACTSPIIGFNAVWVMSCTEKKLYKIDHNKGVILARIATGIADPGGEMSLAVAAGSVWLVSDSAGTLLRVDPNTNAIKARIKVLTHSYGVVFGHNSLWVTNYLNNSVQRIDPKTNSVTATILVGTKPRFITAGKEGVWTLNQGDGTVSRIDPLTNKVVATTNVKAVGSGGDITADDDKIWIVSTNTERPVQTINIKTNSVETIYSQTSQAGRVFKVDGAARVSKKYVWISGYHSKTIWLFKK